ncbi:MAG: preprotein translocase subunit SecA [Christensenellaceae bacterium]|nr:preprotein translocase subunit SecA [Christensenellaceae bacterium]
MSFVDRLLGNTGKQQIKKIQPIVNKINALEPSIKALSDDELRHKTVEFRERLSKGETLDQLLPEAFAVVREAAVRTVGMRPFDVQLIGGIVLHQGRIAEMKTGEGKTLVATLPSYLNALTGKGVHIVTVNDYLASRDAAWMGKIHRFLGLSVGCIVHDLDAGERRDAYLCDITYGTNNEFGFDYLRDNMCVYKENMVQRELNYAIVDEVDSILIDEARTPLIISGQGEKSTDMYVRANRFVRGLTRGEDVIKLGKGELLRGETQEESGDYMCDIKARTVALTEQGNKKAEEYFNIDDISSSENTELNHYIKQALRANALFTRDKDYVVQDGQVLIVDEFTGRLMIGRRYSEGLHQALEAKEGVKVENENKTLATITFQNYFRMFNKLAGMTGTAKTEEEEFIGIYNLDVVEIPTNRPLLRVDNNDVVYTTEKGKFAAVVDEIIRIHETGQPILVGTISVEKSELVSEMLKHRGIKHEVLNAKYHAKEAEIVAQAGKFGNVTIATNMAGRGTDILLGGNPDFLARREMRQNGYDDLMIENATSHAETTDEAVLEARRVYNEAYKKHKATTDAEHDRVVEVGGLYIIGTERHESRRIDNQLRGRAGRQGDPGATKFFVSLEDDLMKRFGMERMSGIMNKLSPEDNIPIELGMITKQIEGAQKRVEAHNFDIRKNVIKYDDVMNKMRELIYGQRRQVLMGEDVHSAIMSMRDEALQSMIDFYCPPKQNQSEWNYSGLDHDFTDLFGIKATEYILKETSRDGLSKLLIQATDEVYAAKEQMLASANIDMREVERTFLLRTVDMHWMDHIDAMDQLRQGIGLRAMGNQDPVVHYRNEGVDMFDEMNATIRNETVKRLFHVELRVAPQKREQVAKPVETAGDTKPQPKRVGKKIGPNDPCPCGSGKKYKKCCGKTEE